MRRLYINTRTSMDVVITVNICSMTTLQLQQSHDDDVLAIRHHHGSTLSHERGNVTSELAVNRKYCCGAPVIENGTNLGDRMII